MAPRWIERIKIGLQDSLLDLLKDAPEQVSLSFEGKVRSQLGQAIAQRYRLQKQLDQLPDLEAGYTRNAELAIDAGDDERAKSILHQKAEAARARREVESQIIDLSHEIVALEALSRIMTDQALTPEDILARFEKLSVAGRYDDEIQKEKD